MDLSFILHLCAILAPGLWLGRVLRIPPALHIGLTFLIFETALVVGAGILTWAGLLGQLRAYQFVTTLCSVAIAAGLWWIAKSDTPPSSTRPADQIGSGNDRKPIGRAWSAIPIACLAVFAVCMLALALSAYPAVEDSLTVKLPKIVFSIQNNSYLPSALADEPRMYMSPVYPALVQLFLILNGQNAHALLVYGFVHWIVSVAAVYQICRNVGASQFASWTATALALLAPMLIVQGSSEGDDIIAATPFLLSLMFFTSWVNDRRYLTAVLAGAGLGLSVVMKFLPLFYVPAIPLIFALAFFTYKGSEILAWIRGSIASGAAFCAAFVFVTLPHLAGNWAAFGNPFYVSRAVGATSNSPFDLGCGLRGVVGFTSQFALFDFASLAKRVFMRVFMHFDRTELRNEHARSAAASFNELLSGMVPFHPTPGCSAYGNVFYLGADFISDNTVWFGVFGPVLLVSVIAVLLSRKSPFLLRALALSLLGWAVAFAMTQRYLNEIGRYWSMMALAGTPVAAVAINSFLRRGVAMPIRGLTAIAASLLTVAFGLQVLFFGVHRSFADLRATDSRYTSGFPAEFRATMKSAPSVNIQVAYGIDTYDYYMLLGKKATLASKVTLLGDMINVVIVRPFAVMENPYSDPRIPVRMKEPFRGGFQYVGKVRPQPGSEYNLGFANNKELLAGGKLDPRSAFLIFEGQQIKQEGGSIVGYLYYIASSELLPKTRFRIGWRDQEGPPVIEGEWKRGPYAPIKVPEQAAALIIQVAFDGEENEGMAEWPLRRFDAGIVERLNEGSRLTKIDGAGR
ncbi:MAG TPA: glycosyltransferase family 39 protein [Xanthobacteraceae bacterium]|nr:glycosyltransferase family 39 protein [Xanthobacteraceae bacterium]